MRNKIANVAFSGLLLIVFTTSCEKNNVPKPDLSEESRIELQLLFRSKLKMGNITKDRHPSRHQSVVGKK